MPKNKREKGSIQYMTGGGELFEYKKDPGEENIKRALERQKISFLLTEGFYNHNLNYASRMKKEKELKFFKKTKDFWEGYKFASNKWFNYCKNFCDDFKPKMRPATSEEKEKYSYSEKIYLFHRFKNGIELDECANDYASEFDLKRKIKEMNREIKIKNNSFDTYKYEYKMTVENQVIQIIDYRNSKIPVYDDDAGQCFYCRLPNGKTFGGGTYNLFPEEEFCYLFDHWKDKIRF